MCVCLRLFVRVCVCVCACVCVCECMYKCVCLCECMYKCLCVCVCVCVKEGRTCPRNIGLNCSMPAMVSSTVGSSGTRLELGSRACLRS
jgi:hypothetical protein